MLISDDVSSIDSSSFARFPCQSIASGLYPNREPSSALSTPQIRPWRSPLTLVSYVIDVSNSIFQNCSTPVPVSRALSIGGAIAAMKGGLLSVRGSTFIGNRASQGGAIFSASFGAILSNCTFRNNSAIHIGSSVVYLESGTIFGCVFEGGGGIDVYASAPVRVVATLFLDASMSSACMNSLSEWQTSSHPSPC
jgi:hypothetical protein